MVIILFLYMLLLWCLFFFYLYVEYYPKQSLLVFKFLICDDFQSNSIHLSWNNYRGKVSRMFPHIIIFAINIFRIHGQKACAQTLETQSNRNNYRTTVCTVCKFVFGHRKPVTASTVVLPDFGTKIYFHTSNTL